MDTLFLLSLIIESFTSECKEIAKAASIWRPLASSPQALASDGNNNLGSGNSAAWSAVALFGAIVLVGWVLVRLAINRTRRWPRVAAYVVGIGALLVPFWFLAENAARLLPQSI